MHGIESEINDATVEGNLAQVEDRGESIGLMEPHVLSDGSPHRPALNDLAIELAAASAGFRRSLPDGVVRALAEFTGFFLDISLDQVRFMKDRVQPEKLRTRIKLWVDEEVALGTLHEKSGLILEAILYRGEVPRGDVAGLLDVSSRTASRVVSGLIDHYVVVSESCEKTALRQISFSQRVILPFRESPKNTLWCESFSKRFPMPRAFQRSGYSRAADFRTFSCKHHNREMISR